MLDYSLAPVLYIVVVYLLDTVNSHGRLLDPPSRSTMWRYGFSNPPNYNDNQLYCGGVQVQYEQNGGRCGVCGDPWQGPRENEPGGKYANGIIVRTYRPGQDIKVVVELTANHKGYFQFKLCPNDNAANVVTQDCFDQYILEIAEPDLGDTKYPVPNKNGYQKLELKVRLPESVRCRDCVFQWKYNAGNNWGTDPLTGRGCIGCGNQEQFYGCADIAVGYDDIEEGQSLITGKIEKGPPNIPFITMPPPPPINVDGEDDDEWGVSSHDRHYRTTTPAPDSKGIQVYKDFEDFRSRFHNSMIQPCVCHTCVGSTCVCECFLDQPGSASSNFSYYFQTLCLLSTTLLTYFVACLV